MVRKIVALSIFCVSVFLSFGLHAADPATEKSIRELAAVTGMGNLGVQAMQDLIPALKKMRPNVPEVFWVEFMNEVNPDEITDFVVPIYQRHFTEQEIQELIGFYDSPLGKKVIEKMPRIMNESMAAGEQWGRQLAKRALDKLENQRVK